MIVLIFWSWIVKWLTKREKSAHKQYVESQRQLDDLKQDPRYSEDYIVSQWNRQRECQLKSLLVENSDMLSTKLGNLVKLEEALQQAEFSQFSLGLPENCHWWLFINP